MIKLFRRSRIMDNDEVLAVLREGTVVGATVDYVDGKPVKTSPTTFAIRANVQPMTTRDLMLVPEGDRFKEQLVLYAPELATVPKLQTDDKVLRAGIVYEVQSADDWGSYVRARVMRIDVGDDVSASFAPITQIPV